MMSRLCFALIFLAVAVCSQQGLSQKQSATPLRHFPWRYTGWCGMGQSEAPADKAFVRLESFDAGGPIQENVHRPNR